MNKEMGSRIREMRKSRNLSSVELADILGITPGFLGLIERGQRGTSCENISKICKIFNVSADYLFFGKEEGSSYIPGVSLQKREEQFLNTITKTVMPYSYTEEELSILLKAFTFATKTLNQTRQLYNKE